MDERNYLIWSHEQGRWWKANNGYTSHLSAAGRFTREQAVDRCCGGMVGTAARIGAMPELMVLLADAQEVADWYVGKFPGRAGEDWQ